jgi:hypothetical protein
LEEASAAVREMIDDGKFGKSGSRVVIEEFLTGPEVSVLAFTDGKTVVPMVSAQEVSMIMADKISRLFDKRVALAWNKNIIRLRRVGENFGMPTEDGSTTYMSPMRYEFYVSRNYEKIN